MAAVPNMRAMDRYQDDVQVQYNACSALTNLATKNANRETLVAAGAHLVIIRAMDRHQENAKVQEMACSALWSLAANDANQVTLVAAVPNIIRAMDRPSPPTRSP
jgi:hypothetical protein